MGHADQDATAVPFAGPVGAAPSVGGQIRRSKISTMPMKMRYPATM